MSYSVLFVNLLLHDTILVHANCSQNVEYGLKRHQHADHCGRQTETYLVHSLKTIDNKRDSNLLPRRRALLRMLLPALGLLRLADITDIKHYTYQDTDDQLRKQ